jgi:NAD(P)-dependent dehydrogenase (short-subunit alcohol dehydrogenase family)
MSLFTLPILEILKDQYAQLPLPSESIVRGGTYIVTGANIGLGYECAKHLVNFSASHVILAVRSQERGDVAKARIESDTGRTGIAEVWLLDLANYDSVKAFAERAMALARLDGIVENASVALGRWSMSEETETMITVNVLSTFLLAVLLLPKMRESAVTTGTIPHIAVISSGAAFSGTQEVLEKLEGDSIEALSEEGNWGDFSSR